MPPSVSRCLRTMVGVPPDSPLSTSWLTGAMMLVFAVISLVWVRETPLAEKPQTPIKPAMLRVLGMLLGVVTGGVVGLAVGGILGGLLWLALRPFLGDQTARIAGFSLGGLAAMVTAVAAGTTAGIAATLGRDALRTRRPFAWWVANRLLYFAALTSIQLFVMNFLMYAFGVDSQQAVAMMGKLMTMVGLFTLVSALPSGWIADRIGARQIAFWAGLLAAAGTVLILVMVWAPSLVLLYAAGIILGISAGLFTTSNWALGTELVPAAEAGRYLGISNLAGAGAGMIGTGLGGPLADVLNGIQPGLGYFILFAIFVVFFALSALTLRGIPRASSGPLR